MNKLLISLFASVCFFTSNANADLPDFTQLVEKQSSAVVLVTTEATVKETANPFGDVQNDPMAEWFRRFGFFDNDRPQLSSKSRASWLGL